MNPKRMSKQTAEVDLEQNYWKVQVHRQLAVTWWLGEVQAVLIGSCWSMMMCATLASLPRHQHVQWFQSPVI